MLTENKGLVRACMEFFCQVRGSGLGGSIHTPNFKRVKTVAIRLIISHCLMECSQSITGRRRVASPAIFHQFFYGYCFSELANYMLPPLARPRCTRLPTYCTFHLLSFCYPSLTLILLSFTYSHSTSVHFFTLLSHEPRQERSTNTPEELKPFFFTPFGTLVLSHICYFSRKWQLVGFFPPLRCFLGPWLVVFM